MPLTEIFSDNDPGQFETRLFDDAEMRSDEMQDALESWVEELATQTGETLDSDEFQKWLDVQSTFHDYSARNTLLIQLQCPEATRSVIAMGSSSIEALLFIPRSTKSSIVGI